MKKIQIPMIMLGFFNLLIPLGIAAQYILATRTQNASAPSPLTTVTGLIPLIFGSAFVYIGIRIKQILIDTPKVPLVMLKAWIVGNIAGGVLSVILGHGINPIGLVVVAPIYWYFSWALNKETGEAA